VTALGQVSEIITYTAALHPESEPSLSIIKDKYFCHSKIFVVHTRALQFLDA
jgi:hypothetical protein